LTTTTARKKSGFTSEGVSARNLALIVEAGPSRLAEAGVDDGTVLVVEDGVNVEGSRDDGLISAGLESDHDRSGLEKRKEVSTQPLGSRRHEGRRYKKGPTWMG
jgi:hypothetical protein